jgi:hypothetical protein
MSKPSRERSTDLGAYALITRDFLSDTVRLLWEKENIAVRVTLGAEHLLELKYALNSLRALMEVLGVDEPSRPKDV